MAYKYANIKSCMDMINPQLKFLHKWDVVSGWETSARPLANASENLAGRVENRCGQVEIHIG